MYTELIDFKEHIPFPDVVDSTLRFSTFINEIEERLQHEQTIKAEFYRFLLKKIRAYPDFDQTFNPEQANQYESLLELIYSALSTTIEDERHYYWALATPVPDKVIFCTEAFYNFIAANDWSFRTDLVQEPETFKIRQVASVYRVILEKLYHFPPYLRTDTIYQRINPQNGLMKYYRIHTNTNYITVKVNGTLPELNPELIENYLYEGAGADVLEQIIPLSMFSLEGFTIITIEDITAQQAIDNVRLALVNRTAEQKGLYEQVIQSLQTLAGDAEIQFGLLPFLKVNGRLIFHPREYYNSAIIRAAQNSEKAEGTFLSLAGTHMEHPKAVFYSAITRERREQNVLFRALSDSGIQSYALLPVFYNQTIAGVMEIYASRKVYFYETLLSKLESVIPLVAQLLQDTIEQFDANIEAVIKDKFTMLQPAVEWKFNEAAWNFIRQDELGKEQAEIATVAFHEVFPLYGAIDIRNSTAQRNDALLKDSEILKQVLADTLNKLQTVLPEQSAVKFNSLCENWMPRVDDMLAANDEVILKSFFQNVINPVLLHIRDTNPETKSILDQYEAIVDEIEGEGYKHRRALEHSIKLINNSLNRYLRSAQAEIHQLYPCYFEKFRTDGVEYDIFTGQSLSPEKPFTFKILKSFRSWQLRSMIEIARLTESLLPQMDVPLRTTQLIFIHSSPIDITFRLDERRFDVEGAYNIRYEVIKKRIDKVMVKGTNERLTQPGKIALVYFAEAEAQEYLEYITTYQQEGKLTEEIEHLDLEDLQGVSGLKALRVAVKYER